MHSIDTKKIKDLISILDEMNINFSQYKELNSAFNARKLNAYFYIYGKSKDSKIQKKAKQYIKKERKKVLKDKRISKKTKYGICLSFINLKIISCLYIFKDIAENIKIKKVKK